jgi:hypothetical protein
MSLPRKPTRQRNHHQRFIGRPQAMARPFEAQAAYIIANRATVMPPKLSREMHRMPIDCGRYFAKRQRLGESGANQLLSAV